MEMGWLGAVELLLMFGLALGFGYLQLRSVRKPDAPKDPERR